MNKNNQDLHRIPPGQHISCKIYSFNSMRFIVTGNDVCSVPALFSTCITSANRMSVHFVVPNETKKKVVTKVNRKKYWHWNSLLNRFHISPLNGFHSACHTWESLPSSNPGRRIFHPRRKLTKNEWENFAPFSSNHLKTSATVAIFSFPFLSLSFCYSSKLAVWRRITTVFLSRSPKFSLIRLNEPLL